MGVQETIVLYPAANPHDLGPRQVDIHLFPATVKGTAHALNASLPVPGSNGIGRMQYRFPINGAPLVSVAPGMSCVESIQHSSLNLYCLGGFAHMLNDSVRSTIELESTAPIVLVGKSIYDDDMDPVDLFVNELGAWLSILRARARGRLDLFDKLLLKVPPFSLYAQGLLLAARHQGTVPVDERNERYWRSYHVIHSALKAAKENPAFPQPMPNFEQILSVA
jgi:hypothetical protein